VTAAAVSVSIALPSVTFFVRVSADAVSVSLARTIALLFARVSALAVSVSLARPSAVECPSGGSVSAVSGVVPAVRLRLLPDTSVSAAAANGQLAHRFVVRAAGVETLGTIRLSAAISASERIAVQTRMYAIDPTNQSVASLVDRPNTLTLPGVPLLLTVAVVLDCVPGVAPWSS
jgi:hypothetical protein